MKATKGTSNLRHRTTIKPHQRSAKWETRRLKHCASDVVELTRVRASDDVYLALEHVQSWTGNIAVSEDRPPVDSQLKRFTAGDVLFSKLRPYLAKVA